MAWTAPRTWVTGEIVTESMLNEQVRDNLGWLKSAHADQRVGVHGLGTGAIVGSKQAQVRIEVAQKTVASTGDGNYSASGTWQNAFSGGIVGVGLGIVADYTATDAGRNFGYIQSYSLTGFTIRLADSGGGDMNCTFHVWALGTD